MAFIIPVLASIGSFLAANAPAITAAASLATAGTTIGETLANQPSSGPAQPPAVAAPPSAAAPSPTSPTAAYIASKAPDVQSQVGGALAPPSFSDLLARLTGNPGQGGAVEQQIFGSSGGLGLSDMYASLQPIQSLTQPQPAGGG